MAGPCAMGTRRPRAAFRIDKKQRVAVALEAHATAATRRCLPLVRQDDRDEGTIGKRLRAALQDASSPSPQVIVS